MKATRNTVLLIAAIAALATTTCNLSAQGVPGAINYQGRLLDNAGQPVTTPGGHCHFWGGEAGGRAEQRAVIERQIARGVDWIKVMATGGVFTKGSGVTRAQFDAADLSEMVALARAAGRPVAAHCHGTLGIAHAAAAGVRTVEHCSFAGDKGFGSDLDTCTVAVLAEHGSWVSPTVNGGWIRRTLHEGRVSDFFERMSAVFAALREAGVPMIASTDAGIPGVPHDQLAAGLLAFARYAGYTPVEVLRAATSESARALGLGDVCGRIRPGLSADLLVVEGDPLQDLAVLQRPVCVVARGEPIWPDALVSPAIAHRPGP